MGLNASLQIHFNRIEAMAPEIDENVSDFCNILLECASYFIPNRIITIRPRDKPYINHACRLADRSRNRWHKTYQRTRDPRHYAIYREKRRDAKFTRQNAKIEHHNRLMSRLTDNYITPKEYWKLMKSIMGEKSHSGISTLCHNGRQIVNTVDKANIFNEYFASQARVTDPPRALPPLYIGNENTIDRVTTTCAEVQKLIKMLDASKANGPDGISIQLLKNTCNSISGILSRIFNQSFEQGRVPQKWKEANVTHVYKKGDKQIVGNYRPISLISVLGKLQERIVYMVLYDHCKRHGLLTWKNSGFKPKDSAMNQLLLVTHKIYQAIDNGLDVNLAFLDISKAFDRVWHIGLLYKLRTLGITGRLHDWLENYLCHKGREWP